MPVAHPDIRLRFPQAPFPLSNGTATATSRSATLTPTSRNLPAATSADETKQVSRTPAPGQTPSSIPAPSYASITVAPVGALPPETTTQSSLPAYSGPGNAILRGHCAEPGYTILDGPTVLWVPVIGCISSKSDCCAQPTASEGNAPAQSQSSDNNRRPGNGSNEGGRAGFPISSLPNQGEIKGCPKDYHTVTASDGVGCCPSSYWLWSTQIGGQTPCYSSLAKAMVPPPIPETLDVNYMASMTRPGSTSTVGSAGAGLAGSITPTPFPRASASPGPSKQTSAIVNIAYAMQYKLAPDDSPLISQGAKIGIAVGAAAGGVLLIAIIGILVKKYGCFKRQRTKKGGYESTAAEQRFASQVDMSRVAHEPAGVARTHGGVQYAGVPMQPVQYRD